MYLLVQHTWPRIPQSNSVSRLWNKKHSELHEPMGASQDHMEMRWSCDPLRWRGQRTMKSTPPKTTPNLQLHMEWLPLKNKQTKQQQQKTPKSQGATPMYHMGAKWRSFPGSRLQRPGHHVASNAIPVPRPTVRRKLDTQSFLRTRLWTPHQAPQLLRSTPGRQGSKTFSFENPQSSVSRRHTRVCGSKKGMQRAPART